VGNDDPIQVTAKNGGVVSTFTLELHGGEKISSSGARRKQAGI